MKPILTMILLFLVSGCSIANRIVESDLGAYCTQTDDILDAHVDALIRDGGPRSVVTGDLYVTVRDKACEEVNG